MSDEEDEWKTGRVSRWNRTFGFIVVFDEDGKDTKESVFVHSEQVNTCNPVVGLRPGMVVKFLIDRSNPKKLQATDVCSEEGTQIDWHEKIGATDTTRTMINPGVTYSGQLKQFFIERAYGWIYLTKNIEVKEHGINLAANDRDRIYVARNDFRGVEIIPNEHTVLDVEFQLYKDRRGIGACKVTGPDGVLLDWNKGESAQDTVEIADGQEFEGTVVECRPHHFVIIKPTPGHPLLKQYKVPSRLYGSCAEIMTEERPARVDKDTVVQFKLGKISNILHQIGRGESSTVATCIKSEKGEDIVNDSEYESPKSRDKRESESEHIFEGTVKRFNWQTGVGWIEPKSEIPEETLKKSKNKTGQIYFHRDDLNSVDKIFGIHQGVDVQFKLYTDEKGLGAENISCNFGEPLSGFTVPFEVPKQNNWWSGGGRKRTAYFRNGPNKRAFRPLGIGPPMFWPPGGMFPF